LSGITEFSGQQYFIPPKGTTAERPSDCPPGSIRFNTDTSHLEYFNGLTWLEFEASSEELGGEDLSASADESENRVSTTSTYAAYGTVAENATGYTLPMSNPSHYGGKARDLQTGGFKITLSGNSASEDFFMGCWIKFDTYSTDRQMGIDLFGDYVYFETRESGGIAVRHNGGSRADSSSTALNDGNWHHIALSRTGDTLYGFLNGTAVINTTSGVSNGTNSVQANENFWFFGGSGSSYNTDAQVIDIFVYGGSGVTSYTTPTAPLIGSDGSINHFSGFSDSDALYISPGVAVPAKSPSSNQGTGHRGLIAGGYAPAPGDTQDRIEYITISTLGNSQDFGNLVAVTRLAGGCASSTRGLFGGGGSPAPTKTNKIDVVTIASEGNAVDFGNLTVARNQLCACSNSIRGIFSGGDAPSAISDVIDYVTIASNGDAVDFGNLLSATEQPTACANSIRGLVAGGSIPAVTNVIQYVTISTTGNAKDFGDLITNRNFHGSCSNSTRGLFGAGATPGNNKINSIEFVTIATTGNATDFGDLTVERRAGQAACSSPTRGVFAGGQGGPSDAFLNTIDCVEFVSTGNAVDFGDLIGTTSQGFACSNGHGGL
jgi:hypothetical protein